jgi:hypothetical protein
MPTWVTFLAIGSLGGFAAGLFGVGGGIVIVCGLGIYLIHGACKRLGWL